MEYKVDKKNFTPQFFKMWNESKKKHKRFVIAWGGAGSSKSYSISQIIILKCLEKVEKFLVVRKVQATLNDSCVALFKEVLDKWEIPYQLNKTDKKITFDNGSAILFKGADNIEKLKSIAGITSIWCEEVSELTQEEFSQVNVRLRGMQAKGGIIYLSFNPISELSWLKSYFFETEREDTYIYHSNYKDNPFLDDEYKRQLELYKVIDPNYYRVYCEGAWGIIATGREMYRFDLINNEERQSNSHYHYNPNEPLLFSFDENNWPFIGTTVGQLIEGKLIVLDEFAEKGKNIKELCEVITQRYADHTGGIIIGGDATSRKVDVRQTEMGVNMFTLIRDYLQFLKPTVRVPKTNESVYLRTLFENKLYYEGNIVIKSKCKNTIVDIQSTKWDKDGLTKDKSYTSERVNGEIVRYQKNGHLTDSLSYLVQLVFSKEFYQFKNKTKSHTAITSIRASAKY